MKDKRLERGGRMTQLTECLPSIREALDWFFSTTWCGCGALPTCNPSTWKEAGESEVIHNCSNFKGQSYRPINASLGFSSCVTGPPDNGWKERIVEETMKKFIFKQNVNLL